MDAREHAYRVLAIIERQRMEVGGTASDGGPGCAPVRRGEQRLDEHRAEAVRLVGEERVRVWRLYLRAARNGFVSGFTGIYQVLATR